MTISPFFLDLLSAYRSEMDDLTFDSDGRDVLRRRLADKRKEIDFLLQMMRLSPEMVAVVFYQAFTFKNPALMDHLLGCEADELPPWDEVSEAVELAPWARALVQTILQAPDGEWFMTVAAGLHYLAGKPAHALARRGGADADDEGDENEDSDDREVDEDDTDDDFDDHESDEVRGSARDRDEAGADWLAEQGFDRKD